MDPDLSQYSLTGLSHFDSSLLDSTVLSQGPPRNSLAPESEYHSSVLSQDQARSNQATESVYQSTFLGQGPISGSLQPTSVQHDNGNVVQGNLPVWGQVPDGQDQTSVYPSSSFQQFQHLFSQAYSQAQASITGFNLPEPITSQQSAMAQPITLQHDPHQHTTSRMSAMEHTSTLQGESEGHSMLGHINQGQQQGQGQMFGSSIVLHPPVHLTQSTNFDTMPTVLTANHGPGFPSSPSKSQAVTMVTGGEWQAPQRDLGGVHDPGVLDPSVRASFLSNLLQQAGDTPANTSNGNTSYANTSNGTLDSEHR